MMGRTHATSGALLFLGAINIPQVEQAMHRFGYGGTPMEVVAGTVAAAGAAMLPDFDHRHATVAHSLPPASKALAIGIEKASGGHRNGTHSILGVTAFVAVALLFNAAEVLLRRVPALSVPAFGPALGVPSWLRPMLGDVLSMSWSQVVGRTLLALWVGFLLAVALMAMRRRLGGKTVVGNMVPDVGDLANIQHSVICVGLSLALVFSSLHSSFPFAVLPLAVGIGAVAHLLGDMLTKEGCPLLWPLSKRRFHVLSLTTDHFVEREVISRVLAVLAVWLVLRTAHLDGPLLWLVAEIGRPA